MYSGHMTQPGPMIYPGQQPPPYGAPPAYSQSGYGAAPPYGHQPQHPYPHPQQQHHQQAHTGYGYGGAPPPAQYQQSTQQHPHNHQQQQQQQYGGYSQRNQNQQPQRLGGGPAQGMQSPQGSRPASNASQAPYAANGNRPPYASPHQQQTQHGQGRSQAGGGGRGSGPAGRGAGRGPQAGGARGGAQPGASAGATGGGDAVAEQRPNKKTRREREFEAQAQIPLVVKIREPANEAERQEIDKWKEQRRKNFPSTANLARKTAEDSARKEAGGLDPKQERMAKLREILALQRSMGIDHLAGTTDLIDSHGGGGGYGGRGGGRGGRGGFRGGRGGAGPMGRGGGRGAGRGDRFGPSNDRPPPPSQPAQGEGPDAAAGTKTQGEGEAAGGNAADDVKPREVAGGVATKYQWVRNGYVPPPSEKKPEQDGDVASHNNGHGQQQYGRGQYGQQQVPQYIPRPRKPSLLYRLLEKDIRKDRSWLLQAIRFLVRNDFLQPTQAGKASSTAAATQATVENGSEPSAAAPEALQAALQAGQAQHERVIDWPPEAPETSLADILPPVQDVEDEEDAAALPALLGAPAAGSVMVADGVSGAVPSSTPSIEAQPGVVGVPAVVSTAADVVGNPLEVVEDEQYVGEGEEDENQEWEAGDEEGGMEEECMPV